MAEEQGKIPRPLGERNVYYREVIPYIHTHILRLTPIDAADSTWLDDELLTWIEAYDDAANKASTNKNKVSEREAVDDKIFERLHKILEDLKPWAGLTATDRNTFRLHKRVAHNSRRVVPTRAPSSTIINQQHLTALGIAIDPLHPNAKKLPKGVFLVFWTGYLVTKPNVENPAPVHLGWSASIHCDLEFPAAWLKKDCMVESHYVDKHKKKSLVSPAIPVTVI